MGGYQAKIMKLTSNKGGIARVRYARPSDGKFWTTECRVSDNRVVWRTVDAFGPGSGYGRWRNDPQDEVFTYEVVDTKVSITTRYTDGSESTDNYVIQ